MIKKRSWKILGSITATVVPLLSVVACGDKSKWNGHTPSTEDTELFSNLKIELKSQATLTNKMVESYKNEAEQIEKALTNEWNKNHPKDKRNIHVNILTSENTSTISQRLDNAAIGAAFLTPSFFGEYAESRIKGDPLSKARQYGIVTGLITGRYPIIAGKDSLNKSIPDNDSKTSVSDLKNLTNFFNKTFMDIKNTRYNGYKNSDDSKGQNFIGKAGDEESVNGEKLYVSNGITENNATANYRGVIIMTGNKDERQKIQDAWDNKDWSTFRNFGLIFQSNTSVSGYQYPQVMLKEHFGKDVFTSIKQEYINYPSKIHTGQSGMMSRIGSTGNIGFTYLKDLVKNDKLYNSGKELRILTVTKPILTDGIGLSGKLSIDERKTFINVFKKLIDIHPEWQLWKVYGAKFWKTDINGKPLEEVAINLADKLNKRS